MYVYRKLKYLKRIIIHVFNIYKEVEAYEKRFMKDFDTYDRMDKILKRWNLLNGSPSIQIKMLSGVSHTTAKLILNQCEYAAHPHVIHMLKVRINHGGKINE